MVAQGHEEVEEQLRAAVEHLKLHRAAALESAARTNDQGQVMCPKLGVVVRRVGVCISSRRQDGAALDARFCNYKSGVKEILEQP